MKRTTTTEGTAQLSTILLIDDDVFARNMFARALSDRGHTVLEAESIRASRALLSTELVDAIIVDAQLSGGEALRAAHQHACSRETILVSLSSVFRDGKDLEVSPDLELEKPISPEELVLRLDTLLGLPTGLDIKSDTLEELSRANEEFAREVEHGLLDLETTINRTREEHADIGAAVDRCLELERRTRKHGLLRVSQATGRMAQALRRIDQRRGELNRQLWAELNDALDDAYLSSRRHLMKYRVDLPAWSSSATHQASVLFYGPKSDQFEQLEEYSERHLITIERVDDLDALHKALSQGRHDGLFVDVGTEALPGETFETLRRLRDRGRLNLPLGVIGPGEKARIRVEAARAGATRFLDYPIEMGDFNEAVRVMAALRSFDSPRIAVVEQDPDFAAHLLAILAESGFDVQHIESAPAVLDLIGAFSPHAMVVNARTSRISGIDLTRTLRAIPRWTDLPILLVTDRDQSRLRVDAVRAGVDDVLVKPIDEEELIASLYARTRRSQIIQDRADRDGLTGLLTRRAFLERVSVRLSEARRSKRPIAIAILDLDRFKRVNDEFGHMAGDRVLSSLGRLLRNSLRVEDLRCRWGGEEIIIALVDESADAAQSVLERILENFRQLDFEGEDGALFNCTFSAGISQFGPDGEQFEELLKVADERLFDAKVAGRNRVVRSSD